MNERAHRRKLGQNYLIDPVILFEIERAINPQKNNIFFAIKGTKIDGNKFISHAIQNGAKTIISNQKFEGIKEDILFIRSTNVRKSLSEFAYTLYKDLSLIHI